MSALKSIRDFKSGKSAPHEKLIDLVITVQCSQTSTREPGMPDTSWWVTERRSPRLFKPSPLTPKESGTTGTSRTGKPPLRRRGNSLLTWLEKHQAECDTVPSRRNRDKDEDRISGSRSSRQTQPESTDQGLSSRSLHAMNTGLQRERSAKGGKDAVLQPPGRSGDACGSRRRSCRG